MRSYNNRFAESLVAIFGDGVVIDPSVDPGSEGSYPTVAAWIAAAEATNDQLSTEGYGMYDPFELYVIRQNDALKAAGIDSVSVTLNIWANQDCEHRVEAGPVLGSEATCSFYTAFDRPEPELCSAAGSQPRRGHHAIWTGDQMLVWGGSTGTFASAPPAQGMAYDPITSSWTDLPSPTDYVDSWLPASATWTGSEMITLAATDGVVTAAAYDPTVGLWRPLAMPDDLVVGGATAWTGQELFVWGGPNNGPSNRGWAYTPSSDTWRELPGVDVSPVEGAAAVWTGDEVIVYGGYYPSVSLAYSQAVDAWRPLSSPLFRGNDEDHGMVWTGEEVLVWGGIQGPSHSPVPLLYDPGIDVWSEGTSSPILGRNRFTHVWTGEELIVWGGYGTYSEAPEADGDSVYGDGAAYNPITDTWRKLSNSPLEDRCDHSAVWTGTVMIVYGGMAGRGCGSPNEPALGSSAAYDPATDSWAMLPMP